MARRVFYSFHYEADNWRTGQVRNIGALEGSKPANDNDWETVKKGGDKAIKKWIDRQLDKRTCAIVLVGARTARRKWINYEIQKSWNDGRGLVGIRVHGLKDSHEKTAEKGENPFDGFRVKKRNQVKERKERKLSSLVRCVYPKGRSSQSRYRWIAENLKDLVEDAIARRKGYGPSRANRARPARGKKGSAASSKPSTGRRTRKSPRRGG